MCDLKIDKVKSKIEKRNILVKNKSNPQIEITFLKQSFNFYFKKWLKKKRVYGLFLETEGGGTAI